PGPGEGRGEQAQLAARAVPARPPQLSATQVAARRQLALRVLERGEHEQVAALVIAAILPPDPLEGFVERREVAHGRASVCSDGRVRTATGRGGCGSSSASSRTLSIVSTSVLSSSCFTSSRTSTMSPCLR